MTEYTKTRIWLHWIVALLVLVQWMSADGMGRALDVLERDEAPTAWDFILSNLHLFCGGFLLLLIVWRLRLHQSTIAPAAIGPRFLQRLASLTHWALLLVLLALPITGALSYYQVLPSAGQWHERAGWILGSLIALHLLALVWHSLQGHSIWRRMVTIGPGATESIESDSLPD